jgi:hypothetical protein
MNDEETSTISIELPLDVWGILALQAHDLDITLNEHLINITMSEVARTNPIKLSPDQWLMYSEDFDGITVMDPDGWDRKNYAEDWAKLLTKEEMHRKVSISTVSMSKEYLARMTAMQPSG